jgi:hypothetical protein
MELDVARSINMQLDVARSIRHDIQGRWELQT